METKLNTNLNEEKNKKGVNLSVGEAAASAAGVAGVSGAAAVGIATGSFGREEEEVTAQNQSSTDNHSETASAQPQEATSPEQVTAQEPVDPSDVPFTETNEPPVVEPALVEPEPATLADVNVDEIVNEILDIEEVNPTESQLAEVVNYEDVGFLYTEDGEAIPADQIAMQEEPFAEEGSVPSGEIPESGELLAMVDDDPAHADVEAGFDQETDNAGEDIDTNDFSDGF